MNVTGLAVKEAMMAANITTVDHHPCGLCRYMCRYVRRGADLFFDPGCRCTGSDYLSPRTWQSAAEWINMQSNPEVAARLAASFGLTTSREHNHAAGVE